MYVQVHVCAQVPMCRCVQGGGRSVLCVVPQDASTLLF